MDSVGPDWELADEVLDYTELQGFDRSRDRLSRWHREGLISEPVVLARRAGRGTESWYPPGTSRQYVAGLEIRQRLKSLDRVKWRLWLDGWTIDVDWVRNLITQYCNRFDDEAKNALTSSGDPTPEAREYMIDAAEREFSSHAIRHIRKRVSKDEFPRFLMATFSLLSGKRDQTDGEFVKTFEHGVGYDTARRSSFLGGEPLVTDDSLRDAELVTPFFNGVSMEAVFSKVSNVDLETARQLVVTLTTIVSAAGPDVEKLAGRWAGGIAMHPAFARDLVEDDAVQIMLVATMAISLNDPEFRATSDTVLSRRFDGLDRQHYEWMMLNRLAREIPDLQLVLEPSRYRKAIRKVDLMETVHEEIRFIMNDNRATVQEFCRSWELETGTRLTFDLKGYDSITA